MCIKIIGANEIEFNVNTPLQDQLAGATEIVVSYDPLDPKIDSFVTQIEFFALNGISCNADIKVNSNNSLDGLRLERRLEKLKTKINVNEVVKSIVKCYSDTEHKLRELSHLCLESSNER